MNLIKQIFQSKFSEEFINRSKTNTLEKNVLCNLLENNHPYKLIEELCGIINKEREDMKKHVDRMINANEIPDIIEESFSRKYRLIDSQEALIIDILTTYLNREPTLEDLKKTLLCSHPDELSAQHLTYDGVGIGKIVNEIKEEGYEFTTTFKFIPYK